MTIPKLEKFISRFTWNAHDCMFVNYHTGDWIDWDEYKRLQQLLHDGYIAQARMRVAASSEVEGQLSLFDEPDRLPTSFSLNNKQSER